VLAGLVLNKRLIRRVLREDVMRESPIVQDWLAEGRREGRQEGEQAVVLRLLERKFGAIAPGFRSRIASLSPERLSELSLALLDFTDASDLERWLADVG